MSELYLSTFAIEQAACYLVVCQDRIWLVEGEVPLASRAELGLPEPAEPLLRVGEHQGLPALLYPWPDVNDTPAGGEFVSLRSLLGQELFQLGGRALQLAHFQRTHRFCGQCGARTRMVQEEIAAHCDHCQHRAYPRLSPSMIVAVRRGNRLLLGRSPRHPEGLFSVLAGFAEPGESLEQTVAREVMEEVSVKVRNIRYHCSQNWPFPHSMMVGFLADYDSGEIQVDPLELEEARWFEVDRLPDIPREGTISRVLIDAMVAEIKGD
ncbi:NAD(+) diphosphatase [Gallaecimonas sp. GXIMD4217]|uniref:NAD(+) diphosphatase n=1 Tax=Gallaecimonas sp. GXIMD4217 TaxID=3131927 RepID=UPI00311AF43D